MHHCEYYRSRVISLCFCCNLSKIHKEKKRLSRGLEPINVDVCGISGYSGALWWLHTELQTEWVGVHTASPPWISPLMSLVLLKCTDAANLFPHDDTEAGLSAPESQYLTHPPWLSSWKRIAAALSGDRLPPRSLHLPAGLGFDFSLKEKHQSADHLLFLNSNFFSPFHTVWAVILWTRSILPGESYDSFWQLCPRWQPHEEADLTVILASWTGNFCFLSSLLNHTWPVLLRLCLINRSAWTVRSSQCVSLSTCLGTRNQHCRGIYKMMHAGWDY